MSISTSLEQTFFKLHCNTCGCVTPHRDNSTTIQCEVCLYSNYAFPASWEYYTGWELAFFWQTRYRAVVGYGVSLPVAAVAGPSNQFQVTVGGKTHWLDPEPQRVQYAGILVPTGTVMLAEPIPEGVMVSRAALTALQIPDDLPGLMDDVKARVAVELMKVAPGVPVTLNAGDTSFVFTRKADGLIDVAVKPSIDPNSIGTL